MRHRFLFAPPALLGMALLAPADPPTYPYEPGGPPPPVPIPTAELVRVPTVAQFAALFDPKPGRYEVELIHPLTGCPVKVCFTLPAGCPRKVVVRPRSLDFQYARFDVVLRFRRDGSVVVRD
jgi:hypothetical protein